VGGGGHFFPGFLEDVDDFIGIGLGGEIGELEFEKDQADGVFEGLAEGVFGEVFFEDEITGDFNGRLIEAGIGHDRLEFLGVISLEVFSPFEVAGPSGRVLVARRGPAADVLGTGGQQQFDGRIGSELFYPGGQPAGV